MQACNRACADVLQAEVLGDPPVSETNQTLTKAQTLWRPANRAASDAAMEAAVKASGRERALRASRSAQAASAGDT